MTLYTRLAITIEKHIDKNVIGSKYKEKHDNILYDETITNKYLKDILLGQNTSQTQKKNIKCWDNYQSKYFTNILLDHLSHQLLRIWLSMGIAKKNFLKMTSYVRIGITVEILAKTICHHHLDLKYKHRII